MHAEADNSTPMERLVERLQPLYAQLAAHPLYMELHSLEDLHSFMEIHVYAVWDFMSLLKALQRHLTCVEVPWMPSAWTESRRLINEIVLGEESDVYEGRSLSHFEIYLLAMEEAGAPTAGIQTFLASVRRGSDIETAIAAGSEPGAAAFLRDTFSVIASARPHTLAAAFTFGREDLIPDMFKSFVRALNAQEGGRLRTFLWYLNRHIEVDGEEHGPMALQMVSELCGTDPERWAEAEAAACASIGSRLRLWDRVLARVRRHRANGPARTA